MYKAIPTATRPVHFNSLAQTTFDLALFSDDAIIVIEAKGLESFGTAQLLRIHGIKDDVRALCGSNVTVVVYGLISSKYFTNISGPPMTASLHLLDGLLSWDALAKAYSGCSTLSQAEAIYKS